MQHGMNMHNLRGPRQQFCVAEAGKKGFGVVKTPKQNPKKKQKVAIADNTSDAVKKAVKLAEGSNSAPIDPKQAARGKIDYVKVKDWGSERQKDPGSLQVESFISGDPENDANQTFFLRLTRSIIRDKGTGLLDDILDNKIAVPISREMPSGDQWVYTKPRYIQYLVDLQAVHQELESGIAETLAILPEDSANSRALDCFSGKMGLHRSEEIATDLTHLSNSVEHPGPSIHILAYVKHLRELKTHSEGQDNPGESGLRLIAHVYANQLHHFTNGSKLGAAIAQKLNLFRQNAVHIYRSYPLKDAFPGRDPYRALQAYVNAAGSMLSEEQRKIVESEVPLATCHSMQLVEPLAYAE